MEIHLPSVPMMEILSYLDAYSLLQAAQVNKVKAPWLNSSIQCTLHETPLAFPTQSWSLSYPSTILTQPGILPSFFLPFLPSFPP